MDTDGADQPRRTPSQKKLDRERPPRVVVTYDVEKFGVVESNELPFVVGVLADLSGQRTAPKPKLSDRRFVNIDHDNFDDVMAGIRPRIAFEIAGAASETFAVDLSFIRLQDFDPEAVARQIPALSGLFEPEHPDKHPPLLERLARVLHAEPLQRLEASWRGLHYLVTQTETSTKLMLRVLDVSRNELARAFRGAPDLDQSVMFKRIYEEEYGTFGGMPFGLLVGDYDFGPDAPDIALLEGIAQIASMAHAPFIAAASSRMFSLESFADLSAPRDIARIFSTVEYARWRSFRESECARYVALTLPRMLLRHPHQCAIGGHGAWLDERTSKATELLWGNPAYALAACITNSFAKYGWCAQIRGIDGGGLVEGLPFALVESDEGHLAKAVTDIPLTDRREKELADLGFVPLIAARGADHAAFFSMQTCCRPREYSTDAANANARLATQLQYVLTASRFVHYLQCIVRDSIGASQRDHEHKLSDWLARYVLLDDNASMTDKARRPLREARVEVADTPGKRGTYRAVIFLRPHFQLDELSVSMRLVAELPRPAWA